MFPRACAKQIVAESERARTLRNENTCPSARSYALHEQRLIVIRGKGVLLRIPPGNTIEDDDGNNSENGNEQCLND